jgi:putative membrane-bound dehydrogenase-like protein
MQRPRHSLAIAFALAMVAARAEEPGQFRVPDGFRVSQFAGDDLVHDVNSMTFDPRGRVVVSGRGYVKTLHDDDGDGRADRTTQFAAGPASGARGLAFEGHDLFCTGDHALSRYRDRDGDGTADGEREVLAKLHVETDHSANGIVRGPDGCFYIACGNDAGVTRGHIHDVLSPVTDPQQGVVYRLSADGTRADVLAHGFRNPYDLDFDADGTLWLVDSDGERDQYLPWYSPTRLFAVATGRHHGWVLPGWQRSWNRPPWFFDAVPRGAELGRGSPTGAVVYRHRRFPERYRGSFFSLCWSLGRVYALKPKIDGDGGTATSEVFLESVGSDGFAPVDIEVGPDGQMYIAIGGRGTKGGVFRIDYVGAAGDAAGEVPAADAPLVRVLTADQPQAAWSRAAWLPVARELGADAFARAAVDAALPEAARVRAIEVLTDLFGGVPVAAAVSLAEDPSRMLRARLAWSLGRSPDRNADERAAAPAVSGQSPPSPLSTRPTSENAAGFHGRHSSHPARADLVHSLLARLTHDADERVRRHAWEALLQLPATAVAKQRLNWADILEPRPRSLRAAALMVLARLDAPPPVPADAGLAGRLALLWRGAFRGELGHPDLETARALFADAATPADRLEAVRLIELCLGDVRVEPTVPDVYAGYAAARPLPDDPAATGRAARTLAAALPSGSAALDREIARVLGMLQLEQPAQLERITDLLSAATTVEDSIHYLIVLSRLPGQRSAAVTQTTARGLLRLHHTMQAAGMQAARFWPARVGEACDKLLDRDPGLAEAIVDDERLGLPDHSLFASRLPAASRGRAARRIFDRVGRENVAAWTPEMVLLLEALPPEERRPILHELWDEPALQESVANLVAKAPAAGDRGILVETLRFGQPATVRDVADALRKLESRADPAELVAAIRVLRQFAREPQHRDTCRALDRLIAHWTAAPAAGGDSPAMPAHWESWLRSHHPEAAQGLNDSAEDFVAWQKRLDGIDWRSGDAQRGKVVYHQRSCARCHDGNARLGPELAPVARRFSRQDLFTAILDPGRDVSPTYRLTQVETGSGTVVTGQLLYESPETMLIQTSPDTTVRLAGQEIRSVRKSPLSPMPSGLLRDATDRDLADLYAYLVSAANAGGSP